MEETPTGSLEKMTFAWDLAGFLGLTFQADRMADTQPKSGKWVPHTEGRGVSEHRAPPGEKGSASFCLWLRGSPLPRWTPILLSFK